MRKSMGNEERGRQVLSLKQRSELSTALRIWPSYRIDLQVKSHQCCLHRNLKTLSNEDKSFRPLTGSSLQVKSENLLNGCQTEKMTWWHSAWCAGNKHFQTFAQANKLLKFVGTCAGVSDCEVPVHHHDHRAISYRSMGTCWSLTL